MKTIKYLALALTVVTTMAISCSDDDDNLPEPINEEEVITTMNVTLTPTGGGNVVTMSSVDLDGDGPDAPLVTVSGPLLAETTYSGSLELLNETVSPAESINEEIEEEAAEHQFFFQTGAGLNAVIAYSDMESDYTSDGSSDPVGLEFVLTTGTTSRGNLTITLRHEPNKEGAGVSQGDITNAGGETDFTATFNISLQ